MNLEQTFNNTSGFTRILSLLEKLKVTVTITKDKIVLDFTGSAIFEYEYYIIRPIIKKSFFLYYYSKIIYLESCIPDLEFRYYDEAYTVLINK